MQPAIVIMAKEPRPGRTKTRLCPPLTPEQAAEVYAACLMDGIANALAVPGAQTYIAVTPPQARAFFEQAAPGIPLLPVTCAAIGGCLDAALSGLLERGHPAAAAVSSDSPDLWPEIIAEGLRLLDGADVVFGPSPDGGYYFVGLRRPAPALFGDDIPWSTAHALRESLVRAERTGLRARLIPRTVTDVDTAADLQALRESLAGQPPARARHIRGLLARLGR